MPERTMHDAVIEQMAKAALAALEGLMADREPSPQRIAAYRTVLELYLEFLKLSMGQ